MAGAARSALLVWIMVAVPGTASVSHAELLPAAETLRVAQYNVQFVTPWRHGTVSSNHWPNTSERARAIGGALACFDLVALNETINDDRRDEFFGEMERRAAGCGRPSRLAGGGYFAQLAGPAATPPSVSGLQGWLEGDRALAWLGEEVALASRLPIVASAAMTFRDARGSDALAAKGVLHARLWRGGDAPADDVLDLFVTHLQANHADIRRRQIAELAAFIGQRSEPDTPAILLGDLNVDGSPTARRDPQAEYHDLLRALAALGFRDPGQALGGTDSWQRRRIDYIFLRSSRLTVANLLTDQLADLRTRALSDHAAVIAELTWQPGPGSPEN
jgi:endonuclease/exonuclease/phosphatase family metal-dependent hydrolase